MAYFKKILRKGSNLRMAQQIGEEERAARPKGFPSWSSAGELDRMSRHKEIVKRRDRMLGELQLQNALSRSRRK